MESNLKYRLILSKMQVYGEMALADPPVKGANGWYLPVDKSRRFGPYPNRQQAREARWNAQKWCREMVYGKMA